MMALCAVLAALTSCTANPHYIGDVCPPATAAANGCGRFAVDLDRSGVSQLPVELTLPGRTVRPLERLHGRAAKDAVWTAEVGGELRRGTGVPTLDLEAPFTDDTRAVGLATGLPSYAAVASATGKVGSGDVVFEVVLRATAGARLFGTVAGADSWGWDLFGASNGALALIVEAGASGAAVEAMSVPLVEGAWYHCLAFVSRRDVSRIDCNGRAGSATDLRVLGELEGAPTLTAGGGTASGRVALLAIYEVPPGGLGPPAGWGEIGARRFAAMTGAGGRISPRAGLRDSPAFLDMQRAVGAARRVFLVGPDWPRVACRSDAANERQCGYLSEPARDRLVPASARAFTASELGVETGPAPFADGETLMEALVPSTATAPHTLTATSRFDAAHHVFSFFARAGAASRVAASAGGLGEALFDVGAGTVVSAPAGVDARIEAWGGGLFRCAYGFDPSPGPTTYVVRVLDAGDGVTAAVHVAGLQVDVGLRAPASPLAADLQAADHLAFVPNDGGLNAVGPVSFALRVLAPAAPRRTDQPILNLNLAGLSEDQVQLFVAGPSGRLEYTGVGAGMPRWTIEHETTLADGRWHVLEGGWSTTSAEVAISGVVQVEATQAGAAAAAAFDQIDVAFSPQSSDHLEGLVAGLRIETP
jgi:hypothetical protein